MNKVIIIGCGGVGTVVAPQRAKNSDAFNEVVMLRDTRRNAML